MSHLDKMKWVMVLWLEVLVVVVGAARPRIIEGSMAQSGEFPWAAALLVNAEDSATSKFMNHFCGGSLIDEGWILTAAHCVVDFFSPDRLSVVVGATDLNSWFEESFTLDGMTYAPEFRMVSEIFTHPAYNELTFDNDVALLHLSDPSTLPTLNIATSQPPDNTQVLVCG